MAFDAKADTSAASTDVAAGDKIPFGDVSADAWDTIEAEDTLDALLRTAQTTTGILTRTSDTLVIRKPGGVAGTDELQISHDGSYGYIEVKDGYLKLICPGSGATGETMTHVNSASGTHGGIISGYGNSAGLCMAQTRSGLEMGNLAHVQWGTGGPANQSIDTVLSRAAANIVRLSSSTGSAAAGLCSGARTPSQITADQNDYSPGVGIYQRWSSDASRNITGMAAGQDGEVRFIWNVGSQNIVLQNENASSSAANRLTNSTGADITLAAKKCAMAMYDSTSSRWRVTLLP